MQEYVIELSKYFIAFFMVLYTASCFYTFRYPTGEHHKGIFILQDVLMFLVQVLCFLNLSLTGGDFQYLFFFAFILIFLFATITMVSLIYENINRLLLNICVCFWESDSVWYPDCLLTRQYGSM